MGLEEGFFQYRDWSASRRKIEWIEGEVHPCTSLQEDVEIWRASWEERRCELGATGSRGLEGSFEVTTGQWGSEGEGLECGQQDRRGEGGAGRMLRPPQLCWSRAGGCGGEEGSATISWEGFRSLLKSIHGSKRKQEGRGRSPKLVDVEVGRKRYGD